MSTKKSTKDLPNLLDTLKKYESDSEASGNKLSCIFDACLKLHDIIEDSDLPSNEKQYQEAVKICIRALEQCTHMVNKLDLFSSNEAIEEVETSSIRYLMLPALLGNLNLSLQTSDLPERFKYLEFAEVYFKDFVLRCKNYELSKRELINSYEEEVLENDAEDSPFNKYSINELSALRDSKIKQYRLRKELKDRENELKPALDRQDAPDEYIREYYLVILERWMLTAVEELVNIKSEKAVIRSSKKDAAKPIPQRKCEIKPLKPIIITRNDVQKKVFGLGYPSLPVMTIDDFYQQRFEKMVKEHRNTSEQKSLQDMALSGGAANKDDEAIQKEMLLEKDDAEALNKERAWDDWKDDNPRGSGNRKNKG